MISKHFLSMFTKICFIKSNWKATIFFALAFQVETSKTGPRYDCQGRKVGRNPKNDRETCFFFFSPNCSKNTCVIKHVFWFWLSLKETPYLHYNDNGDFQVDMFSLCFGGGRGSGLGSGLLFHLFPNVDFAPHGIYSMIGAVAVLASFKQMSFLAHLMRWSRIVCGCNMVLFHECLIHILDF